jgi:phosphoribosylaminoimidazolecarboxamide formyltransferase/IMP cyclohydrolase
MNYPVKISSALISVFDKEGLEPIVKKLHACNVQLISTGGTQKFIENLGIPSVPVEQITDYPSIFGGRVKTLHPKIFGGILYRRDLDQDREEQEKYQIPSIDLVIVDLYPFAETVRQGKSEDEIIEKIDIGGISLIRAAAKNFRHTLIVSSKNDYEPLLNLLNEKQGETSIEERKSFANRAFKTSSMYDAQIHQYFSADDQSISFSHLPSRSLRYGENPHQKASFFGDLNQIFEVLNGKELSYNNMVDADAALQLIDEFAEPTVAIIKHTNSCGLSTGKDITQAYHAALACDPVSAFGGVIVANRTIDETAAQSMNSLFFEILIAPDFEEKALDILKQKKNRILIKLKSSIQRSTQFKTILNGIIQQDCDPTAETRSTFTSVTERTPNESELTDLEFAIKAVKHLKSNGIALVKNQQLIGMGCGMTSRVDALRHAISKANEFGFDLRGSVMASDAFFPFPDCVEIANEAGIIAIAQPGGSIKDQDSVDAANRNGQSMVMTGVRHFRH